MDQFNIEKIAMHTTLLRRVLISSLFSFRGNEGTKYTKKWTNFYLAKKYYCFGHKKGVFVRNYPEHL